MAATNDQILSEIKSVSANVNSIEKEVKGLKASMFGSEGTGGIARTLSDLSHTIGGNPAIPDSRGMAGDVNDLTKHVEGINGEQEAQKSSVKWLTWSVRGIYTGVILWLFKAVVKG